jgi:hypothetical protein
MFSRFAPRASICGYVMVEEFPLVALRPSRELASFVIPTARPRRSRRGRIWMVVWPLCATPFDIYKCNAISAN